MIWKQCDPPKDPHLPGRRAGWFQAEIGMEQEQSRLQASLLIYRDRAVGRAVIWLSPWIWPFLVVGVVLLTHHKTECLNSLAGDTHHHQPIRHLQVEL